MKRSGPSGDAPHLAVTIRTLAGKLKRKLREQTSHEDFTPSQVSVLLRLESEGPATASNLISGSPDPNDGRQTLLSLTPKCRERIQQNRAAKQDWLTKTIEAKLSSREQEQLKASLELLARLVED